MYKVQEKCFTVPFWTLQCGSCLKLPPHVLEAGRSDLQQTLRNQRIKKNLEMSGIFQGCNRVHRKDDVGEKLNCIICGNPT